MGAKEKKETNQLLAAKNKESESRYLPYLSNLNSKADIAYKDAGSRLTGLSAKYEDLAKTGGFEPGAFDKLRSTFGGGGGGSSVADELAKTGGVDESKFAKALQGYESFANGGGIDSDAIRARSNSAVPSFYKGLQNSLEQRKLINPYAPTFDAESRALARQKGQETQRAIRDTELDISDRISSNKKYGISGMADLNSSIQGMIQQGKISGGNQQISNAGLAESAASRRQAGEMGILQMLQEGRLKGIGGLEGLYQTQNANAGGYSSGYLSGLGGLDDATLGYITSRQNPGAWWSKAAQAGGTAAAAYFGAKK